jgi:FdhD protein
METHETYKALRSFTHQEDQLSTTSTELLVETPLEIIINRDRRILIMFTPAMIRELVAGFLFTEGMVKSLSEIEALVISQVSNSDGDQAIEANVTLPGLGADDRPGRKMRVSFSSCGVCGKENYYELKQGLGRVKSRHRFSMRILKGLPEKLEMLQPLYQRTGGAHAAVLFDPDGQPIVHCEDMGRHNALDKVIGSMLLKGIASEDKVLLSSGRASLEMILKTARAGFPVFVAMSRPTSRAVEAAKFYNITLVDLAKDSNRIYSHVRRIDDL